MPILVRPVREQLEHDRIIRLLEAKWRRKFKVDANPGDERHAGVKVSAGTLYPDLILTEEGGRKPKALVEVETNESVNHLEAMAQWANLAKSRTSLLLFVPVGAVEAARRLANDNAIKIAELWTYLVLGDQVRFTSVFREDGAGPADLIEKVEMFTTERPAPAPRPVPVEPAAPVEPPPAAPERARKLAVKAGSRPLESLVAHGTARIAAKSPAKSSAAAPAAVAPKPPAKVGAARPADKPAPVPRPAEKPVAKAAAKPEKPAANKVTARPEPGKPVAKAAPAKAGATKAAPVKAAPVKAAPVKATPGKAAPARPAVKTVAAKAVAGPRKPVSGKPARPAPHKAAVARPAARASAPSRKAAPAAKASAAKRK